MFFIFFLLETKRLISFQLQEKFNNTISLILFFSLKNVFEKYFLSVQYLHQNRSFLFISTNILLIFIIKNLYKFSF